MNPLDRVVAGLSCRQVLDQLSDFLDHDLPVDRAGRIREHLQDCHTCEQFGGRIARLVAALRLQPPSGPPHDVVERLQQRLGRRG